MRVLDLLQLLHDYDKNTPVRVRVGGQPVNIGQFERRIWREQPQLIFQPRASGKALKCWELMVLIDKHDWRQHFVYVQEAADVRPLFGLQAQPSGLVLN
ncbi:hypothetical protein ACFQ5J_01365 [Lacticaseibacillus baoqingensis]|uniref:Terminase n=1 Tax=Lacticaseibacillus baoqingensis TaxID=2486013 RepID=A0ABW4E3C4_9LACO|nr:hypothetical protein [Lacticaseibacillus baoqingensis]